MRAPRAFRRYGDNTDPKWIGGATYALVKWQFQLLHKRFGLKLALDWAEDLITWKDIRRPGPENYLAWALEVDLDDVEIPEKVERTFSVRMDNAMKAAALQAVRSSAKASQAYSTALKAFMDNMMEGEIDDKKLDVLNKLSSSFMHANNGTGFMYREVAADKQQQATGTTIGNLVINAGQPTQYRRRLRKDHTKVIEAEVKELPVGA